ncbi:MAG: DUF559 domain-containing protein [Cryobacterium sp.]
MTDATQALVHLGGIAHARRLRATGVSQKDLERACLAGAVHRIRSGWYCLPHDDSETVQALRVGGRVTCVSRLEPLGVWLVPDGRLHVAVNGARGLLRSPQNREQSLASWCERPVVVTHWRGPVNNPTDAREMIDDAAACLAGCLPRDHAIVAFDSLLNLQLLTAERLAWSLAGAHREWMVALLDAGCASGLETLARLHLRGHNLRVRVQVQIAGVGRVDLVVGDRLVIELDSRKHHTDRDAYERDRSRDLELVRRGYLVVRVTYLQVMTGWASVERAILEVTRRGEHRWQRSHRRAGLDRAE